MSNYIDIKKHILPPLPKALKLPSDTDLIWSELVAKDAYIDILRQEDILVNIEEKVDGSSVAICIYDGNVLIRNKDKLLRKGHRSDRPSKKQYLHLWNWVYENADKFKFLESKIGRCSVYGEWMWMQHGLEYNQLPSWLIAFDIYSLQKRNFLIPELARELLEEAGFSLAPQIPHGSLDFFSEYVALVDGESQFTSKGNREGTQRTSLSF